MKKAIAIASLAFMASCSGPGLSERLTYEEVRKAFPTSRIYHAPGSTYMYWIVVDSTGAYRAVTGEISSPRVTRIEKLIELR